MKPSETCNINKKCPNQVSPDDQQGKIILIPDDRKVMIHHMVCRSEEVYAYMDTPSAQADPVGAIIRALECGASVLRRASSRVDYEHIEKLAGESFIRLERAVTEYIQRNLDPSEQGTLARRINDLFRIQQDQIKETITKGDLHVTKFQEQMAEFAQSLQGILQSTVTGAMSSDQSGISLLLREIKTEVQTLRDSIVSRTTQEMTSPPVKGACYEEEIFQLINKWAVSIQGTITNIIVEDVRTVSGPLGKKGDVVVRLIAGVESRICVEMKTQERISANRIIEVCKAAKENRSADMVIYVADDAANLPAEFGVWTQLDAIIITSTVGFEIALKIAASRLLLKQAKSQNTGIDVERALALLQDIDSQLKKFGVFLSCSRATIKNAEKAQAAAIDIRSGIEAAVEDLIQILNGKKEVE